VTGAQRSPSIPELPTVAEAANLPGFAASAWFGIVGPAGMPKAAVTALSKASLSSLEDAEVRKRLFNAGVEIRTSTPEEFARYIASEMQKWAKVVKESGAKVE
jgi:tripartite-type tricarboxylate transporter receptor subunit TctC